MTRILTAALTRFQAIPRQRTLLSLAELALQTTQQHEQRGLRRGISYDGAATRETELIGGHAVRAGEADVDQTDWLALGCAARPGDAGGSDREIRAERAPCPLAHLPGALGADSPPRGGRLSRDPQERRFRLFEKGADPAEKIAGRT